MHLNATYRRLNLELEIQDSSIDAAAVMNLLLLKNLFKAGQGLAQNSGLDPSFIVMVALIGALVLISVLITLLVWLRYLVAAGLVTTSAVTAIRWRRGEIRGPSESATQGSLAVDADDLEMLEHGLDVLQPDR